MFLVSCLRLGKFLPQNLSELIPTLCLRHRAMSSATELSPLHTLAEVSDTLTIERSHECRVFADCMCRIRGWKTAAKFEGDCFEPNVREVPLSRPYGDAVRLQRNALSPHTFMCIGTCRTPEEKNLVEEESNQETKSTSAMPN